MVKIEDAVPNRSLRYLVVKCPETNKGIQTPIRLDVADLRGIWSETIDVDCPYCNRRHSVTVRDAYIEHSLALPSNAG